MAICFIILNITKNYKNTKFVEIIVKLGSFCCFCYIMAIPPTNKFVGFLAVFGELSRKKANRKRGRSTFCKLVEALDNEKQINV